MSRIAISLLIVDDQSVVREGMRKMIEEADLGFSEIIEAGSGPEALKVIRKSPPDIMLVDIVMTSDMSGFQIIEELRQGDYPPISIIIVSAHDKFEYAKKAINYHVEAYLLKPISKEELVKNLIEIRQAVTLRKYGISNLESQEKRYYANMLRDYLTGKNPFFDLEKFTKDVEIENFHARCNVMILCEGGKTDEAQEALLCGKDSGDICFFLCHADGETIVLVNFDEQQNVNHAVQAWEETEISGFSLAGVSDPMSGIVSMTKMYQQAKSALEEARISNRRIVFFHQVKKYPESMLTMKDYKKITSLVKKGDLDALHSLANHIFFQIQKNRTSQRESIRIVIGLCSYLNVYFSGLSEAVRTGGFTEDSFRSCAGLLQLKARTKEYFSFICRWYERQKESSDPGDRMAEVEQYIKEHYAQDISLAYIANKFGFDYYYLSRLFKKHFGVSYLEYLTEIRLERATKLLMETKYKIYEISVMVGYQDVKYFSRLFKQHYATTPEQYRGQDKR